MKSHPILLLFGASVLSASLFGFASVANAATFDLTFTYNSGDSTTSSGTGSITIDDALIVPNQLIFFSGNVNGIQAFSATFTNLAATPTTTTLGLSDLIDWVFETDAGANITDLNFVSNFNGDGYSLSPSDTLIVDLGGNGQQTFYDIGVTPAGTNPTTPEPATLLGLLAFGTVGVLTGKRKK